MQKNYPDTYTIVDYPTGNPPVGTAWLWRTTSGWAEKRSDGTTAQFSLSVESSVAPTVADLGTPWSTWFHYIWDMANRKATVWEYKRTPISDDILPPLTAWEISLSFTPVDKGTALRLELPQAVAFEYTPSRSQSSNFAEFPAGVLSGIAYQYMDENNAPISKGSAGHIVSPTDTAAGLGIIDAPANARSVQIIFSYINGGHLTYDYPIPQP